MKTEEMKAEEMEAVSLITAEAFHSKFSNTVGLTQKELQTIITLAWLEEAENFGLEVWTVKKDEKIVGVFGLSKSRKPRLTMSFLGKVTAIAKYLGIKRFFVFMKILLETNHKPGLDELYIDFIAVKKDSRNQNIGQFIMKKIDTIADEKEGINKVSLFVLKENERARHVYEKAGFRQNKSVKSKKYDYLTKILR